MGRWRQARAIALLPGTVTVVVPAAILITGDAPDLGWGFEGVVAALPVLFGLALIAGGLALWMWTVRLFARIGKRTLAPWDPTSHLVVEGPYRHVRNPMISAVLAVLLGEATLFGSPALLIWFAAFFAINWAGFLTATRSPASNGDSATSIASTGGTCPAGSRDARPGRQCGPRTESGYMVSVLGVGAERARA